MNLQENIQRIKEMMGLNEYIDPIYYIKNKLSPKTKSWKPSENIKYEEKFQKYVDLIFKITINKEPIKELKGFKVIKITPLEDAWIVLIEPIINDWFNYRKNEKFKSKLLNFEKEFERISKLTDTGSPFNDVKVEYFFYNQLNEQVYDYEEERNEVPDRLPFDIKKLLDVGAVFVTPAIQGDPNKENYKEWLDDDPHTHLITLHNVENSPSDSWIHKAITKQGDYSEWQGNFVDKIYDGKYNQILWSLNELGIDPMDMLLDDTQSINESDSTEEYIKKFLKKNYHPIRISNALKTSNLSFYEYTIRASFLSKNNDYEDIIFTLKFNVDKTANALGDYNIHIFEAGPFYVMGLKNDLGHYILDIIVPYLKYEIKNSWFNW